MINRAWLAGLVTMALLAAPPTLSAQQNVGGVYVDPEGTLRESSKLTPTQRLELLKAESSDFAATANVSQPSLLRKVSLRRLEELVAEAHAAGKKITAEQRFLAGVSAVQYVFFYADTGDVVIAGPAEGWEPLPTGEVVGKRSRRPVLHLDDLIVALRFAFDPTPTHSFLGCSIEPTDAGFQSYAKFMQTLGGQLDPSRIDQIASGMAQAMGAQDVKLYGAPDSSRFALTMIAADYRLKRLALAHDPAPIKKFSNYLDLAAKNLTKTSGPQPQHRWWFIARYDAIRHTADRTAFEFEGQGIAVQTAPTSAASGSMAVAPKASRSATLFAESFTRSFPAIAAEIPVFRELQNLIALSVAAALIRQHGDMAAPPAENATTAQPANWKPLHFLDERQCPIAVYAVPQRTQSLANVRLVREHVWMFSVSGGVEIDPATLIAADKLKLAAGEKLGKARIASISSAAGDRQRFWWD